MKSYQWHFIFLKEKVLQDINVKRSYRSNNVRCRIVGFLLSCHPSLVSNCGSVKPCESQPPPSSLLSVFVSYCISAVYFTVFPALKKRSIQTGWLPFLLAWPGTPQLPTVRNSSIQESARLSINKQQVSWITPCGRYSLLVGACGWRS